MAHANEMGLACRCMHTTWPSVTLTSVFVSYLLFYSLICSDMLCSSLILPLCQFVVCFVFFIIFSSSSSVLFLRRFMCVYSYTITITTYYDYYHYEYNYHHCDYCHYYQICLGYCPQDHCMQLVELMCYKTFWDYVCGWHMWQKLGGCMFCCTHTFAMGIHYLNCAC